MGFSRGDTVDLPYFSPPCGMAAIYGKFRSNYSILTSSNSLGALYDSFRGEGWLLECSWSVLSLFPINIKILRKIRKFWLYTLTHISDRLLNPKACTLQNLLLTH